MNLVMLVELYSYMWIFNLLVGSNNIRWKNKFAGRLYFFLNAISFSFLKIKSEINKKEDKKTKLLRCLSSLLCEECVARGGGGEGVFALMYLWIKWNK